MKLLERSILDRYMQITMADKKCFRVNSRRQVYFHPFLNKSTRIRATSVGTCKYVAKGKDETSLGGRFYEMDNILREVERAEIFYQKACYR